MWDYYSRDFEEVEGNIEIEGQSDTIIIRVVFTSNVIDPDLILTKVEAE